MMILLAVGKIFYSDFGLFYQVTQNSGAIYSTTNTIDTYVYRTLIQTGDVGMSAAAGVYQSVVGFFNCFNYKFVTSEDQPGRFSVLGGVR